MHVSSVLWPCQQTYAQAEWCSLSRACGAAAMVVSVTLLAVLSGHCFFSSFLQSLTGCVLPFYIIRDGYCEDADSCGCAGIIIFALVNMASSVRGSVGLVFMRNFADKVGWFLTLPLSGLGILCMHLLLAMSAWIGQDNLIPAPAMIFLLLLSGFFASPRRLVEQYISQTPRSGRHGSSGRNTVKSVQALQHILCSCYCARTLAPLTVLMLQSISKIPLMGLLIYGAPLGLLMTVIVVAWTFVRWRCHTIQDWASGGGSSVSGEAEASGDLAASSVEVTALES